MGRKHILKEKELLEAIRDSYGITETVAQRLHCNWHTADEAIKRFPNAARLMNDENERVLDYAESKAIERIKEGDGTMIRFMLATKGKKRGYTYEDKLEDDDTTEDNTLNVICDGEEVDPIDPKTADGDE